MYPGAAAGGLGQQQQGDCLGASFSPTGGLNQPTETCQICVPNSAVGALIGAGGSNIKQIIRDSNAFVTVSSSAAALLACRHWLH